MVSYKRLNPEDVQFSGAVLEKEPSLVRKEVPVSPDVLLSLPQVLQNLDLSSLQPSSSQGLIILWFTCLIPAPAGYLVSVFVLSFVMQQMSNKLDIMSQK